MLAVVGLAAWSYSARSSLSGLRLWAMLLKTLAVVALGFCLLEPMQRLQRARPGANVVAVLVDNSRSMEIRPAGERQSRVAKLRQPLDSQAAWQSRLAQDFDVRRYAFDDRLRAVEELEDLDFGGSNSALAEAISTLQSRFSGRHVAGLFLFTDGLATDDVQALLQQGNFPFPLFPVVSESEAELRDVSLRDASVRVSSFELAPASVEATVAAQGLANRSLSVRLLDTEGKTLDRQTIECDSDLFERRVRFQFQPRERGYQTVVLRAMLESEDVDQGEPVSRLEVTTANNSRLLAVDRGGGPYRILYVSGRPNWEFKFIRRALEEDIELVFHGLLRIAKKEPKFSFRDQLVEDTNPLLAGFSEDEETVEQHDEPVLIRVGEGSAEALKAGFPSGQEELFSYHALILDDVEAGFFSQQQMLLMREFVASRGGGLLMLGGQESFVGGGYRDTPLGDVLPVYLRPQRDAIDKQSTVRYRLTREGALEPWLRLRPQQSEELQRFAEMPDFLTWNPVSDIKPGASLLAEIDTTAGPQPGLVAQRFGKGRTLSLLLGDLWRWSMRRENQSSDDLGQNWRQIARWLTSDVPRRVEVRVAPPKATSQPHRLTVVLRDAAFQPLDNATVRLSVTEPDGGQVQAVAAPDANRPGVYVANYWSATDGGYLCELKATAPDGAALDTVFTGWTAQPSAAEFARIQPDMPTLQRLAEKSGGELVPLDQLDSFAASLPSRNVPVTEIRIEPLWHRPWFILFAIGCLCLEWGLRRWKGLP
ncbi:MAG: hypothetical protein KDA45_00665 [Planctomycetales bacterium]|nr:hypothetical protein [Planctomycetales bacterium]